MMPMILFGGVLSATFLPMMILGIAFIKQFSIMLYLLSMQLSIHQLATTDLANIPSIATADLLAVSPPYYHALLSQLWDSYDIYLAKTDTDLWVLVYDENQMTQRRYQYSLSKH